MEKKPTQAPKAPAQAFAKQELLRERQEASFADRAAPFADNVVHRSDEPSPQPLGQEAREPFSHAERVQEVTGQRQMPRQPMICQQQERKTLTESSPKMVGEHFSEEPGRVPRSVFTKPILPTTILVPVSAEQGHSKAGPSHTATASTFRPVETANTAPVAPIRADGSRKMARVHAAQHTVKRVQAGVEKVKEEVDEQPDLSPGEYAEQRVESYSGSTLRYAEAKLESAGTALRKQAIRQFQEKRQEGKQADEEQAVADAETRAEDPARNDPTAHSATEAEPSSFSAEGASSEPFHPEPAREPVKEPIQAEQPRQEAQKHLTYRDRDTVQQTTEPADRDPSAGSSISEEKGGRAHAQRQTKRSEWQERASGLRVQDQAGRTASAAPAEGSRRPVSPTQGILPGAEKETGFVGPTQRTQVKGVRQSLATAGKAGQTTQQTTKTVQQTARTAQKTAQASAKAAQAAKEVSVKAGRAAVKVGQAAYKVLEAVIKAIMEGAKALFTAIAAGGWMAVLVIAMIAVFAVILNSAFGLFWSNETTEGRPMSDLVRSINYDYEQEIENIVQGYEQDARYDEVQVTYKGDNDGDSASVNNWNDVLAVYSVLTTTDETDPHDVITPSAEDEAGIRAVFRVMNRYNYTTRVEEEVDEDAVVPKPTPDKDGKIPEVDPPMKTVLYLTITQYAMTYKEAAQHYGFTDYQNEILEEMMSPRYFTYFAALIGVDLTNGVDLTEIVTHLPTNSKGAEVVKAALSKLGAPYVWGAKGANKFDCSGLAYWAIKQVDPALGDKMYTNAAGQARYCYGLGRTVARSELQPGDLVFWVNLKCEGCHRWKEIHHVGIYIGDGKVCEASSGHGRVIVRDLWESKNYPIYMFGRPYSD